MVAGEVESSCQSVATYFLFLFFGLTLPNYRNKSGSAQPPLISTTSSAADVESMKLINPQALSSALASLVRYSPGFGFINFIDSSHSTLHCAHITIIYFQPN